jgi:hypothetical protein
MPEAKDIRVTDAVRHEVNASRRLRRVEGFFGLEFEALLKRCFSCGAADGGGGELISVHLATIVWVQSGGA